MVYREESVGNNERVGQYSYIGDDGKTYTVKYSAGVNGFRSVIMMARNIQIIIQLFSVLLYSLKNHFYSQSLLVVRQLVSWMFRPIFSDY